MLNSSGLQRTVFLTSICEKQALHVLHVHVRAASHPLSTPFTPVTFTWWNDPRIENLQARESHREHTILFTKLLAMPSTRPCAAFEPISPDFDLHALVESTPNFEWAVRIHCDMIDHQGLENFEKLVLIHVILGGKPLVIEGYQARLDRWTFALQWLHDNCGSKSRT